MQAESAARSSRQKAARVERGNYFECFSQDWSSANQIFIDVMKSAAKLPQFNLWKYEITRLQNLYEC